MSRVAQEIDRNLTSADIILMLVSASFIVSKYCWSIEMKKALERHDKGEAKVIPVILRPCSGTRRLLRSCKRRQRMQSQ